MSKYHSGKYACSNDSCKYIVDKSIYYKGCLCDYCESLLKFNHTQAVKCEECGAIHHIRNKIDNNEPKYVIKGLCYWCNERKKEEEKYNNVNENNSYNYGSQKFSNDVINKIKNNDNKSI